MSAAVTYTFANSSTADATQVNQNFTDLVNYLNNSVVPKDGSVSMTGLLTLPASDPSTANQATRKAYVDAQVSAAVPTGVVFPWTTASAPTGYLLTAGQAVSRTTYAPLFAVISTVFGAGDGSTTFNLPDLRGREPRGLDDMGVGNGDAGRITAANTLGAGGGASIQAFIAGAQTSGTAQTSGDGSSHTHDYAAPIYDHNTVYTTTSSGAPHFHYYDRPAEAADSNLPPYIFLNYIIKT